MNCQLCGSNIPFHRTLRDREYCCVQHRSTHREEVNRLGLGMLMRHAIPTKSDVASGAGLPPAECPGDGAPPPACAGSLESKDSGVLPHPAPIKPPASQDSPAVSAGATPSRSTSSERRPERARLFGRPVLCSALCLSVAVPLVAATVAYSPSLGVLGSAAARWQSLREAVRARASVELAEDFGDDLRRWAARRGQPENWVHDGPGFIHPSQLAIYIKSVPLADYRMEFLGLIDRNGLGFVYRAMDFDNYYAARITILQPGPIPEVALERYTVVNGHAGPKTQVKLPFAVRLDTLYAVQVEARGDRFVIRINDQLVDAFSDGRLPSGGIGFFSAAGDSARIRSLRVTDRDDLVGKICSSFAPRFGD